MAKILVTGGLGFIGSHLVQSLAVADRHQVFIVDDMRSSVVTPGEMSAYAEIYTESIHDFWFRRGIMNGNWGSFDAIYHLASPVGPAGILKHTGRIAWQIVEDTYHIIGIAQRNACRLVFVSTSEIYGGGDKGLCAEDMPRHIAAEPTARLEYAVAKLASEIAVQNTRDLDAVIVRPFNVAGPRQRLDGGFVLPRFVKQALIGQPLTVFGDGQQVRAFTHVLDIVQGLVDAMRYGKSKEAYNLGNDGNRTSILNLAYRVIEAVGQGSIKFTDGKAIFGPLYAEAADKYPDASKAARDLLWKPTIGIPETIADVIEYEQARVKA